MFSVSNVNAQAIYKLVVNGTDITTKINSRLNNMTVTDNRGIEADSVLIELLIMMVYSRFHQKTRK